MRPPRAAGGRDGLARAGTPLYHRPVIDARNRLAAALVAAALSVSPASAGENGPAAPAGSAESGGSAPPGADAALRRAWDLIDGGRYSRGREELAGIQPETYELGASVLYLRGASLAREGAAGLASSALEELRRLFPASVLGTYLDHELAFSLAKAGDTAGAASHLALSAGRVIGGERLSQEAFASASLLEEKDPAAAALAHLDNLASHPGAAAAGLSMERLLEWRAAGRFSAWSLTPAFYARLARSLARAGEGRTARSVWAEAAGRFPSPSDRYPLLLGLADICRLQGDLARAGRLLAGALDVMPDALRPEAEYLLARVEWRQGLTADARRRFMAVAERWPASAQAESARYQAALIAERANDPSASAAFAALATAADGKVRREALFRRGYLLYRRGKYVEAASAFTEGEKAESSPLEKARHAYWRARALKSSGDGKEGEARLAAVAADQGAGPYAFAARWSLGREPFAVLAAAAAEPPPAVPDHSPLWDHVMSAPWSPPALERLRRARRLAALGLRELALMESAGLAPEAPAGTAERPEAGMKALLSYLAGDLHGAVKEAFKASGDVAPSFSRDNLLYPLLKQARDASAGGDHPDTLLIHAVIRQESLFDEECVSPAGALGLMQLMPRTARREAADLGLEGFEASDLLRPEVNVKLGTAHLGRLMRMYGRDVFRVLAAYNAGEKAVAEWWGDAAGDPGLFLERIGFAETSLYVRLVLDNLVNYLRLYRPLTFGLHFAGGGVSGAGAERKVSGNGDGPDSSRN